MKKKWILCALAILFIISEGERNWLRNDNRGGDICPACYSKDVAEIRYGLYDSKNDVWKEEIESGKVVLGGCMISEASKRFYCNDCGYKWGALEQNEAR